MSTKFDRAITIKQMATYLGVTLPTIYAEAKRGKLVISKIGSRSIILPNDAERYLQNLQTMEVS